MRQILGFLTVLCSGLIVTAPAHAQTSVPEFHLDISLLDTVVDTRDTIRYTVVDGKKDTVTQIVNGQTVPVHDIMYIRSYDTIAGRAIGYDPNATDAYDKNFGEVPVFPSSPYDNGVSFDYPPPGTEQTTIDIRHKPNSVSFRLIYTMNVACVDYPKLLNGKVYWNPSQIPSAVTAMTLSLNEDSSKVLADMKSVDHFYVTQAMQANTSHTYQIILYYGNGPFEDVAPSAGGSLISSAEVYPNPTIATAKLFLAMREPAQLSIVGYDVTGRECLHSAATVSAGPNQIALNSLTKARGAMMLHIEATSASGRESRNVMVMAE